MQTRHSRFLVTRPANAGTARLPTRSGAAVLEMALTLMILLALTFGSIEFGDAYFKKNTLQGAAREGAREAIVAGSTEASAKAAAATVMTAAGITSDKYTVTVLNNTGGAALDFSNIPAGTAIRVTVTVNWGNVGLRPMNMLPADKVITGVAVMRRESN